MKKVLFVILLCVSCVIQINAQDQKAVIKLDVDRTVGEIDPMLYGGFIEHIGRCIYGGIYEPGNALSDEKGYRKDVLKAVKELDIPVMRWPGGNFSSGYHWLDGVGPRSERPKRIDLAWGAVESNQIGTDEFIEYCRMLGTEPYLCTNLGTGSWDEAQNWVEYCNRPKGTKYADLRVKNGHEEPYKVKYWGLGNEIDGPWQMGYKNAEDYAKYALEAAKLMRWMDKSIKLIASGSSNFGIDWMEWNRTVLNTLQDQIDYISLHTYVNDAGTYYDFMAQPVNVDQRIERTAALIEEARMRHKIQKPIAIAYDEYNVWNKNNEFFEVDYVFQDALVVSGFLNSFIRHADVVKMANMAQIVNVLAPIHAESRGLYLYSIYYALQLFSKNMRGTALDSFVQCSTFDGAGFKKVPYLDVSAAYQQDKQQMIIAVVNRHKDQAITAEILNQTGKLAAKGTVYQLYSDDLRAANSFDKTTVEPKEKLLDLSGNQFSYTFPAHSLTLIKVGIEK